MWVLVGICFCLLFSAHCLSEVGFLQIYWNKGCKDSKKIFHAHWTMGLQDRSKDNDQYFDDDDFVGIDTLSYEMLCHPAPDLPLPLYHAYAVET